MCLYVKDDAIAQIAEKNITCYKLVELRHGRKHLTTIYRNARVEISKTYKSPLNKNRRMWGDVVVDEGLHSYARISSIFKCYTKDTLGVSHPVHVVKCVIPKGSVYYKGTFDGLTSYASNMLTYKKIVHTWRTVE